MLRFKQVSQKLEPRLALNFILKAVGERDISQVGIEKLFEAWRSSNTK